MVQHARSVDGEERGKRGKEREGDKEAESKGREHSSETGVTSANVPIGDV